MTGAEPSGGPSNLSEQQLNELHRAFNMFDRDGSGTIDKDELYLCLKAMGHYPSPDELNHLMEKIDIDGNGTLDFNEFAAVMATTVDNEHADEELDELRAAFHLIDADGSGRLDHTELQRALQILGLNLNDEEILFLMEEIDKDGDGISFDEFFAYILNFKDDGPPADDHGH